MPSQIMSFQSRNNNDHRRNNNTRTTSARQEWIPRASAAPYVPLPTPTAVQDPLPPPPPPSRRITNSNLTGSSPVGSASSSGVSSNSAYGGGLPHENHSRNNRGRGGGVNVVQGYGHRQWNPPRKEQEVNRQKQHLNATRKEEDHHHQDHHHHNAAGTKDASVPQLVQEIQDKLMKGTVECMICYDMVRRSAPIWSCSSCYSIFHLNCIKKWAKAPTSVDLSAEKNQGLNWRCPGCQSVQLISSKEIRYICFCGKRPDPPSDLYLTPHSCGEPCGRPLEKKTTVNGGGENDVDDDDRCPHNCVLQCHPGPCPPCKAFAPPRLCPCGKKTITTRCSDRKSVLTCGQCCDKVLECGRHRCQKKCHVGPCEPCQVTLSAICFCKKEKQVVLCGEMTVKGKLQENDGVFSCSSVCGSTLSCGNHTCGEICHPGPCGECELMPLRIKTCHCGKTKLEEERKSCLDPIPTCPQICGKLLPCGIHHCKELCHIGDCAPCKVIVSQSCRCGSSSRTVECFRKVQDKEKFLCDKPCGRKKSCGRHRCSERCCPLFSNSSHQLSGDWDPHLCSMSCGKKLRCGQHSCESLCHSGHCPPCLETIFTELACACGKTSIPPPLPCGTPPPSCQHPCLVPQPCGHFSSHSCHFGDCPPCSIPVVKECVGGHVFLRNIPCGSRDIRCNQLCGKTRVCGMHACARTCHPPPCDPSCMSGSSSKASCGQTCGAPRRDCRHTCTAACHPSTHCPDLKCQFPVTITCSCGRLTATVPCDAGGSSTSFQSNSVFEASVIQKLPAPLQVVEANGKRVPLGQRKLVCDEECAKMERKRVLADAFEITSPNLDALHFGDNSTVSELLADMLRRDPKWILSIEERFKFLVLGKNKGSATNGLRCHVFCPMLKDKRDAARQIAERWKLSVHAAGWEPKRFLVVHVTPKSKVPPRVLGPKGSLPMNVSQPPSFDPLVDMDPRLVVSLLDLPGDADISALVLRFGGECELVWLNDKNALAVFSDPARAATARRRLDHGTAYHGASVVLQNGPGSSTGPSGVNAWGGAPKEGGGVVAPPVKANPWRKAVVNESSTWNEGSWGSSSEDWSGGTTDVQVLPAWKKMVAPPITSKNRWNVLDPDKPVAAAATENPGDNPNGMGSSSSNTQMVANAASISSQAQPSTDEAEMSEVVDDWEKAYD